VLPLPIPTLVAFFRHTDFRPSSEGAGEGAALVAVPEFTLPEQDLSRTGRDVITGLLYPVSGALSTLRALPGLGFGELFDQLNEFVQAIIGHTNVTIVRVPRHSEIDQYEVHELSEVILIPRKFPEISENANNEFSSMIFFCAFWRKVECSNDHLQQADKGEFVLSRSPWYFSGVRNLHAKVPEAFPDPGLLRVERDSTEADKTFGKIGFGDTITSFKITYPNA
jgi:hypothetical protein